MQARSFDEIDTMLAAVEFPRLDTELAAATVRRVFHSAPRGVELFLSHFPVVEAPSLPTDREIWSAVNGLRWWERGNARIFADGRTSAARDVLRALEPMFRRHELSLVVRSVRPTRNVRGRVVWSARAAPGAVMLVLSVGAIDRASQTKRMFQFLVHELRHVRQFDRRFGSVVRGEGRRQAAVDVLLRAHAADADKVFTTDAGLAGHLSNPIEIDAYAAETAGGLLGWVSPTSALQHLRTGLREVPVGGVIRNEAAVYIGRSSSSVALCTRTRNRFLARVARHVLERQNSVRGGE